MPNAFILYVVQHISGRSYELLVVYPTEGIAPTQSTPEILDFPPLERRPLDRHFPHRCVQSFVPFREAPRHDSVRRVPVQMNDGYVLHGR
jgi:hypothetical protein